MLGKWRLIKSLQARTKIRNWLSGIPEGSESQNLTYLCFLLPISYKQRVASQEIAWISLAKTYLCTLPIPMHIWAIRNLLHHTKEGLVSQITFLCCWRFIKQPGTLLVLFCAQAHTLNWESLESILDTSKLGQIQNYILPPWSNIFESILSNTPNVSANIYWKKFAICLVFMYLLLG